MFLTHNQNAHVLEELLKSMKDSDALTLGYAHLVEGTQHSESLSKAYLDTIKISSLKVNAIVLKKNNHNKFHDKHKGSKHRSQSKGGGNCHNFKGIQHRFKLDSGACGNLLPPDCTKNSFHMSPDKRYLGQLITECNCYPTIRKKYVSMVCVIYM